MKTFLQILLFCLLIIFENLISYGCTCPGEGLKNSFKRAKAVFIGTLPQNEFSTRSEIKGAKYGTALEVVKAWKGVENKYFSVTTKFENVGMCSLFLNFEKGKQYIIFANGEDYVVMNYCSYTEELYSSENKPNDYFLKRQQKLLKELNKLGNFWFRLGKRLDLI